MILKACFGDTTREHRLNSPLVCASHRLDCHTFSRMTRMSNDRFCHFERAFQGWTPGWDSMSPKNSCGQGFLPGFVKRTFFDELAGSSSV